MKNLTLLSVLILCCCTATIQTPPNESTSQITPTWSDEFNAEVGAPVDETVWNFDIGNGEWGWGNNQLEYDTNYTSNVSHDGNGNLQIVAIEESYGGMSYTSGRIHTLGKVEHGYGRYEARLMLPFGQGLWPAFWLMGSDFPTVGWPNCGEIDVMEINGAYPDTLFGTVHGPGYSVGTTLDTADSLHHDFHIYAVEIEPEKISFWIDDTLYQVITPTDLPPNTDWVYDGEFFILLNLAIGGNFVGSPDFTTSFPATYLIDYVRFYELSP